MKTFCPGCGPDISVDEDACCTTCGALAYGSAVEELRAQIERLKRAEAAWVLAVSYPEMQLRLVSISHAGWRALKDALEVK